MDILVKCIFLILIRLRSNLVYFLFLFMFNYLLYLLKKVVLKCLLEKSSERYK